MSNKSIKRLKGGMVRAGSVQQFRRGKGVSKSRKRSKRVSKSRRNSKKKLGNKIQTG